MLGEPPLEVLMRFHLKEQEIIGSAPFAFSTNEDKLKVCKRAETTAEVLKLTLYAVVLTGLWLRIYYADEHKVDMVQQLESVYFAAAMSVLCIAKRSIFKTFLH